MKKLKIIRCKDCKHQRKIFHDDRRFKNGGYYTYGCDFISDPFVGTPVYGLDEQFCSSAEEKDIILQGLPGTIKVGKINPSDAAFC